MLQLAREFGVHRRTVRSILERHGVERGQRIPTATQMDEAICLYQSGLSLAEVGNRYGVEHSAIRKHLITRGIARRGYAWSTNLVGQAVEVCEYVR